MDLDREEFYVDIWVQTYAPIGGSLGLSALVAAIPIVVLFLMLGVLRKPAWMAAIVGARLGAGRGARRLRHAAASWP